MIYISSSFFKFNKLKLMLNFFLDNNISNLELSYFKYENNISKQLQNYSNKFNFLIHNYFPPPQKEFVFNLASNNKKIQNESIKHAKKAIRLSSKLKSKYYSFHAGFLIDPKIDQLGKKIKSKRINNKNQSLKFFIDNVNQLSNFAKKEGIILLIENNVISKENYDYYKSNPFLMCDLEDCIYIMNNTPNNVNLLIDVGHLNVSARTLKFNKYNFLQKCKKWIKAYHLSNNNGFDDQNALITEKSWFWNVIKKNLDYYSLEINTNNLTILLNQLKLVKKKL